MAAPTFVAAGTVSAGTTSVSPAYPSGIQRGDLLIMLVANKYPTNGPSTPSGWTAPSGNQDSGGSGASGLDTGSVYATVFTRQADGTESGTVSVTLTSANSSLARIVAYRPQISTFSTFAVECQSGSDNTAGTGWSVTTPSLDVQPDDVVIAGSAINTDAYTFSAQSVAIAGATFAAAQERQDSGTTQGDDSALVISEHTVTAGTVDDAATYTMTASGTTTDRPAGATVLVRIREVEATQAVALLHQELAVILDDVPGAARLYQQEVFVLLGALSASVSATTVAASTTVSGTPVIDATVAASTVAGSASISGTVFLPIPADTVAATTTVESPTLAAGSTVTTSTVASAATVGAPTLEAGSTVAAVTVDAAAAVASPTVDVSGDATVTAAVVAAAATVGTVTVSAGATVTATTVDATTTVSGEALTPATTTTVAAAVTVGSPTVTTGSTVTATTVDAVTTVPSATVSTDGTTILVSTVAAAAAVATPARPSLRYVGTATDSATVTTLSPSVPSGEVGDGLLLMVGAKGGTPSVNTAGWTEITGAAGTSSNGTAIAADTGDPTVRAFYKRATTTSETVSVSTGGTGVVGIAKVFRFALGDTLVASFDGVFIDDPTANTSFGGTSAGSLSAQSGDVIVAAGFVPSDTPRFSAQSVAISGCSIDLTQEALDGGTSAGNDLGTVMTVHTVASGSGTGTVTYAATASTGTNAYGPVAVVRVTPVVTATPATVAATTTIGTAVVQELLTSAAMTLGGLTDVTVAFEDRQGWTATITSPVDGSLVTDGGFTVAGLVVAADNGEAEMQVQISTSSTFVTVLATSLSNPVDPGEVAYASTSGLSAGVTYYLRARGGHSATDEWGEWSTTVTVTTSAAVGNGYAYLYASDVDTSVPVPHIWWTIYDPDTGTVTVVGTGFGDTAGEYNGEIWANYEPGGTTQLTPTSWSSTSDTGDVATADREILYGVSSDSSTNVVVATAPVDVDDRGLGVYIQTDSGGVQTSTTSYSYPADAPTTRTNTGWWVEVRDFFNPDTVITSLHSFQSLSFTKTLNDAGVGEVVISREDPFFDILLTPTAGDETEGANILTFPLYFSFMQDGAERFRMLYDGKAKDRASATEAEKAVLSGTGRAMELSWGVVLPATWPADVKAHPRKRDSQVWAPLFITLFNEAQARGEIPDTITLGFTATHDSYGQPWDLLLGESDREVEIGTTLFDLLQTWADAEEFDWIVTPRGKILAAPVLGQDLTNEVRFFNAVTNTEVSAIEDRKDLRTRVYVEGTDGHISYVEGEYAMDRWGVRAMYLRSDEARSARQRLRVARGTLRQVRRPNREKSVKVPYEHLDPVTNESYGRTVFQDYGVADTIGLGPKIDNTSGMPLASRDVRVQGITLSVDPNGIDVELLLETRVERFEERVRRLLAARLGEWSSAKTARQGKGGVHNARDTDVDGVVTGETIIWDRDAELWKNGRPTDVWPFWFVGPLSVMTSKMYLPVDATRTIRRVTARLGDPSTAGPVTFQVKRNDSVVHTMTITEGDRRYREIVTIPVTQDDDLSIDITASGTDAGYLQVVLEAG